MCDKNAAISVILILVLFCRAAFAATIVADTSGAALQLAASSGPATLSLSAFSEQAAPAPLGPNAIPRDSGGAGGIAAPIPGSISLASSIALQAHILITYENDPATAFALIAALNSTYAPLVGAADAPKPSTGERTVTATSGGALGAVTYLAPSVGAPKGTLTAQAQLADGTKGSAAAEGIDPVPVLPGLYNYDYVINNMSLDLTGADFAGGLLFASDTRFSDPLWSLTTVLRPITGSGVCRGRTLLGDLSREECLDVFFVSNPILGLQGAFIEADVRNAFTISDGMATLSSFELFKTMYPVNQPISFSEGNDASVTSVGAIPEPSTIALLSFWSVLLFGYRWLPRAQNLSFGLSSGNAPPSLIARKSL
jgi:hypothetical protein